jgi:hypothetical protein
MEHGKINSAVQIRLGQKIAEIEFFAYKGKGSSISKVESILKCTKV